MLVFGGYNCCVSFFVVFDILCFVVDIGVCGYVIIINILCVIINYGICCVFCNIYNFVIIYLGCISFSIG